LFVYGLLRKVSVATKKTKRHERGYEVARKLSEGFVNPGVKRWEKQRWNGCGGERQQNEKALIPDFCSATTIALARHKRIER